MTEQAGKQHCDNKKSTMLSFLKNTQNPAAERVQQSKVQHGNLSNFELLLVEHLYTTYK